MKRLALKLIGAALVAFVLLGAVTSAPGGGILELGLANGDSEWVSLSGSQACAIWSTSWDSATVDMETLVAGTRAAPTKLLDVDVAALLTVTTDTGWVRFDAGTGYYRLEIGSGAGSESVNWHCRPIP